MKLSERSMMELKETVPGHLHGGIILYIENGIEPGGFLQAVVQNDLREALGRADHINRDRLWDIVSWFWNYAPSSCWGSVETYNDWMAQFHVEESTVPDSDR